MARWAGGDSSVDDTAVARANAERAGELLLQVRRPHDRVLCPRWRAVRVGLGCTRRGHPRRGVAHPPDRRDAAHHNQADPSLPALLVCRPELATPVLDALRTADVSR